MPYKLQLSTAKASGPLRTVAGVCPNSDEFRDLVNEVQERLWRRGNWWDSAWTVRLCIHNSCITWPRWAGTVLGMRSCTGSWEMQNRWFNILGRGCYTNDWRMPIDGMAMTRPNTYGVDNGTSPLYSEITGNTGKLIRYYVRNYPDIGKTIRIFGLGYGNQPLQEQVDGVWRDGITITAAAPFGTNAQLVTKITSVVRDATSGMSYLYAYDSTTGDLQDIAQYEPTDTNPRFRRTNVAGYCNNIGKNVNVNGQSDATQRQVTIEALIKLQFIPAVSDDDFLFIDVMPALKLGIQAVKLEEANQDAQARAKWLLAIDELNMEDRDKVPSEQTVVVESVIGGGRIMSPT